MKILYFLKNSSNIFSVILVFMQMPKSLYILLDYVILLHAAVLGMTLKGLVKFISGWQGLFEKDICF